MGRAKVATSKKYVTSRSSSAAELLVEIGSEELPFDFIAPALALLKEQTERMLAESRLSYRHVHTVGTPRRLVVVVNGLTDHQAATTKETMGPSKAVAFDQTGQPTKAAIGFASGQGLAVEDLHLRQTPKGDYLFAVKREEGQPAREVLTKLVPQIIAKLSFPKSMKWNEAGVRFARPVRWLLALFGGAVLPIEIAGIKAGHNTYGHRVLGGGKAVVVRDYSSYVSALKRVGVIVDQDKRRTLIHEELTQVSQKAGVHLNADEALLEQATYSTEWPVPIVGSFRPEYLSVPSEILITSMKEHQGFFSVRDKKSGALAAHFIAVANNEVKDMSFIRQGNERVLAARLADARFFYDEDRKTTLVERATKLSGVVFHQKLGTMAQKQDRITKLAGLLAQQLGMSKESVEICSRAASLCKADLLSGIVGEFPELQGVMGGYYAQHDGEPIAVSHAIMDHYKPRAMEGDLPRSLEGQVVSMADRIDTIAAFFHVGMVPTGSEDPFALRRHATAIVRIVVEAGLRLDLGQAIEQARTIVAESGFKAVAGSDVQQERLVEFLFERVRYYGRVKHGLRDDVMDAVLVVANHRRFDVQDQLAKMGALQGITTRQEFDPLIIGFKRAHRLVEKEQWDRGPVDPATFEDAAETELHRQNGLCRKDFEEHMRQGEYQKALDALVRVKPAIDAFFAGVMVNAEDSTLRDNRLSLLKDVDDTFMSFADFSRIVVQGS
ncbi:MAG TPA: glycine--tRNA ligase subunit beta [Nitrospiraceae bacterium]